MASNLKAKFEKLAADQTRDPTVIEHVTERPKPGAGWSHSGHSGGGHTGHDGKFRPNEIVREVRVEKLPPPAKKSLSDLP